jgi:dTDP-4-dehydrorhamnose reductase
MMRLMVTGAAGQLGSTVVERLSGRYEIVPFTRHELDIADERAVLDRMAAISPGAVINCAAYNDVDGAESDAMSAIKGNALGVRALARASSAVGATLVHYSTDFVFDGEGARPYSEGDPARPLGNYGLSKLLGEYFALEVPSAYVLRVESLFGGKRAKSSVDKILAGIRAGQPVRVFADRTVSPSYVDDVVDATDKLLVGGIAPGLYHCVNDGSGTWLDIAVELTRLLGREADIVPVSVNDVKLTAKRPRYCALANDKLRMASIKMPTWQDALRRYVLVTQDV